MALSVIVPMLNEAAALPGLLPQLARWRTRGCEVVVVEGVGGWAAPLGDGLDQCELPRALALPVVLVVGLRLGCLSHARLTARAIAADGRLQPRWR